MNKEENIEENLFGLNAFKRTLAQQMTTKSNNLQQATEVISKIDNCLYCGNPMESITAKKRFCSKKCGVYYGRWKKRINTEPAKINYIEELKEQEKKPIENNQVARKPITISMIHKHPLWHAGDPEEGTNAFYLRKGVWYYDEL